MSKGMIYAMWLAVSSLQNSVGHVFQNTWLSDCWVTPSFCTCLTIGSSGGPCSCQNTQEFRGLVQSSTRRSENGSRQRCGAREPLLPPARMTMSAASWPVFFAADPSRRFDGRRGGDEWVRGPQVAGGRERSRSGFCSWYSRDKGEINPWAVGRDMFWLKTAPPLSDSNLAEALVDELVRTTQPMVHTEALFRITWKFDTCRFSHKDACRGRDDRGRRANGLVDPQLLKLDASFMTGQLLRCHLQRFIMRMKNRASLLSNSYDIFNCIKSCQGIRKMRR